MTWSNKSPTDAIYQTPRHREARAQMMAELEENGGGVCCLGGEPIDASMGRNLHADHCPRCLGDGCGRCGGSGYRGLACAAHNRADGARRGRAKQTAMRPSRDW